MECAHENLVKRGREYKSSGIFQKYQCRDCGKYISGEILQEYPKHD